MNDLPWFRFYKEAVDDAKLRSLAFEDRWHYVALECCRRQFRLDASQALSLRMLAAKLELDAVALRSLIVRLDEVGLIDAATLAPTEYAINKILCSHTNNRPAAHIWRAIRDFVFKRDDYTCRYCGARGVKLECDHVIPVSKGGEHAYSNLVTACRDCNRSKGANLLEHWMPA